MFLDGDELSSKSNDKTTPRVYQSLEGIRDHGEFHSTGSTSLGSDASDLTLSDMSNEHQGFGNYAHGDLDFIARGTWTETKEKVVLGPYDYIASEPGKDFRTLVLNAFNAWLEIPDESLKIITDVVRMLHTSSLLIDDIQDNSTLRRGKPVAHNIFGMAQTINAGNYVYFQALDELSDLKDPTAAMKIYTAEMLYLHRGQGMDLYWRDTLTCPTEEDYLEMASHKTGGLFRLAVKLMQSESSTDIDCLPLVNLLGLIYQIADDHKNLSDIHYAQNKGTAEDLTEGKFSFPIIHSIRSDTNNKEVLNILARKPEDLNIKKRAVNYIEHNTRSLEYAKHVVDTLIERAFVVTEQIDQGRGKSQGIRAFLEKLYLH